MPVITDLLYEYWIGRPDPSRWPEEWQERPLDGHARYAFQEGLRLGFLLVLECIGPEYLR